jgi:S-adenosylmethionine decarboxylase
MLHLLLDLYECNPDVLSDESHLRQFLEDLPDRISMQHVGPVELRYITTSNPLDDGYSGFVIIATSHCSLHAWAPYGMVNLDVFSCEDFNVADVVAFVRKRFATEKIEIHEIRRASRSPRQSAHAVSSLSRAPIQAAQHEAQPQC